MSLKEMTPKYSIPHPFHESSAKNVIETNCETTSIQPVYSLQCCVCVFMLVCVCVCVSRREKQQWLVALLCGCMCLFASRQTMPLCLPEIAKELNWDKQDMVIMLSASVFCYWYSFILCLSCFFFFSLFMGWLISCDFMRD